VKKLFTKEFLKSGGFKVLLTILLILTALFVVPIQFENDTFYMIRIGEDILKGNMFYTDTYSIHANLFYYFPHFLFDILVYFFYAIGGFKALYLALVAFVVGIGFFSYYVCHTFTKNKVLSLFLAMFTLIGLHPCIAMRSQIASFYLFLWQVYSIQRFLDTNKKRYLVYLGIIPIILANTHLGVWPLYLILYLPFLITNIKFQFGKIENKKYKNLYYLLIPLAFSLLTPMISPTGIHAYEYFVANMTSSDMLNNVGEHLPPNLSIMMGKFLFVYLLAIIIMWINTDKKIYTKDFALVAGLTIMALMSRRHIGLLVLLTIPFLASYILNMYEDASKERKNIIKILYKYRYAVTGIVILAIFGGTFYIVRDINRSEFVSPNYPIKATEYIKEHYDLNTLRLFNDYSIGSYLVLEHVPVFIDSRADVYDTKFNKNTAAYKDYLQFKSGEAYYLDIIDKYKFNVLLIRKNSAYLKNTLEHDNNFKRVYEDNQYIIYEYEKES